VSDSLTPVVSTGADEAAGTRASARRRPLLADAAVVIVAALILGSPAVFTHDGFMSDFTNHLWLVWVQQNAISHHLLPTYFISAPQVGVFYPVFEFYGGTLYAVTGALAALLRGHVTVAYVATMLLSVAAAYGGLLWLARQLGVRSWLAHAPAIVFVTSAYYVSNLYGRGAWTELVATSVMPLLVASGLRVVRSREIELVPASLFVVAAVVFTGSHNVTLLLGSLMMIALGLLLFWALGVSVRELPGRRLALLGGLFVLGAAVNAWFLLPNVLHASDVQVSAQVPYSWKTTGIFNTPGVLFNPLRAVPSASSSPALFVQMPDWFLVWILAAAMLWRGARRGLRRSAVVIAAALLVLLALVMIAPLWDALPRTLREVQFPYRLDTYVVLCVAGLMLVGVMAVQGSSGARARLMRPALAGAIAISVALCAWQLWVPNTEPSFAYRNRSAVFVSTHITPHTWYDDSYTDASTRVIYTGDRMVYIDPQAITGDHVSVTITPPPGTAPFATNIAGGPYAVRVSGGIVPVGRTPAGLVVARRRSTVSGPVRVSLATAGGAISVGRVISLISLLTLLGLLIYGMGRRARAVRAGGRSRRWRPYLPLKRTID
jgi:hypothetical protein